MGGMYVGRVICWFRGHDWENSTEVDFAFPDNSEPISWHNLKATCRRCKKILRGASTRELKGGETLER